ncbi:MATE family efflux transporter [Vibrio maerlii]|uniref:MATE family efflux transporter n=1 Tax=Vibrio maerlii TaxID=2231648 RepID=UPI000E3D2438|nr:MATE family efflux transporter [Vibrio maerlii]
MSCISPTLKLVIERTLPLTVGMFAIMLVQLVDSIFIGMLGIDELAVHGITLPFQTALIGVQVGIGVAATSLISRACGAGESDKSKALATITALVGTGIVALICLGLWLSRSSILTTFVTSDVTLDHFQTLQTIFNVYWPVWLLSATSVAALYLLSCVYRANEDTKTTGNMFLLASIINLILDPLLIFTFDLGIIGAAIASTMGYLTCVIYMVIKAKKLAWFGSLAKCFKTWSYLVELARMSANTIINQLLPSVSAFICMVLVSRISTDSIAFWSLLSRMESFLLVFTLALTMSVPPMIGRYLGQKQHSKINALLITTAKFLLIFHTAMALVLAGSAKLIIPLISSEAQIQDWFAVALWVIPFSYAPLGLCMLVVSVFNALGAPRQALLVSMVRLIALYVPAIWIGASTGNILHVVYAATIANTLAGVYAWHRLKIHTNRTAAITKLVEA